MTRKRVCENDVYSKVLEQQCIAALESAKLALQNLEQQLSPSWEMLQEDFYLPLYNLQHIWGQINHLQAVADSKHLRSLQQKYQAPITEFYVTIGQSKTLYAHFKNLKDTCYKKLNKEAQKVIDNELRDFTLSGITLPQAQQKQFKSTKQKLALASIKFEQNLLDSIDSYSKYVKLDDLSGVPHDIIESLKTTNGEYKLTLHIPCYLAIMQYANNRALREELYYQYVTRASRLSLHPEFNNSNLIREILALRGKQAQLLGFSDFTQLSLYTKMANNSKTVLHFLYKLAKLSRKQAQNDLNELVEFASSKYNLNKLEAWDIAFISERLRQEKYSYSEHELKQYFPLNRVLDGLFRLIHQLYNVEFLVNSTLDAWHKDVITYTVRRGNVVLGYLQMDLFVRASKQSGAWMNAITERFISKTFNQLPIVTIVCNFTPPGDKQSSKNLKMHSGSAASTLSFDEVQTLFHEMGHALHQLLSTVNHYTISGTSGVEWDAVELPSQFMEYFVWDYQVLQSISCHVKSNQTIPQDLYHKLIASRFYLSGMQMLRQLEFAIIDIKLHQSSRKPLTISECHKIVDGVRNEIAVVIPPKYNRMLCSFSHIFAGGYAAGYYSYKWAEVLATDIFSVFDKELHTSHNVNSNKTLAKLGNKFYSNILSKGGMTPMHENFIAFMGREPELANLLKYSGINTRSI